MKFKNAYRGIGKIKASEIFSVLTIIAGALTALLTLLASSPYAAEIEKALSFSFGSVTILALVTIVLLGLSAIMKVVGLIQAGKDEGEFKKALLVILLDIVIIGVSAYFSGKNEIIYQILNILTHCTDFIVMLYVVSGICSLADKMFNNKMITRGKRVSRLIIISFGISLLADIVVKFIFKDPRFNINVILTLASAALNLIKYLFYLIYLGSARRMLED